MMKRVDACYIKSVRKSNGDTAEFLAKNLGITITTLYYVENGVKNISDELLNKIISYYHVSYDTDMTVYEEAYNLTIKVYESYVFKDKESLAKYENEFLAKEHLFECSRAFIFNKLILAIINLLKDRSVTGTYIEECREYLPLYDSNIAGIFAIVYACFQDVYLNLEGIKQVFTDIYENNANYNLKPSIKAMMHYEMGRIASYDNEYLDALKFYERAISKFHDIYCIERINQVKIDIASAYSDLCLYEKAEEAYLMCLDEAYKYNFDFRIKACLNNLAWLYFVTRKYDKCIEYVNKAMDVRSYQDDIKYYLAYCTYQTKGSSEARKLTSKFLSEETNTHTKRMLKMIQGFINDNYKDIDSYFERSKKLLMKYKSYIDIKVLYEMNIIYYKDRDQKRYLHLLEEYFEINKQHLSVCEKSRM